jgi:hypothetical protein
LGRFVGALCGFSALNAREISLHGVTLSKAHVSAFTPTAITASEFNATLESYRSFESKVSVLMQGVCAPYCGVCKTPCCRVGICREAFDSPFLLAVHGAGQAFDRKSGYLGGTGCKLITGRPPLCHAFVCGLIVSKQPSDEHRYALDCLGDLVGFIQSKVWQKRQLVEAMTEPDLLMADKGVFDARLILAESAFSVLDSFFIHHHALGFQELEILSRIRRHELAEATSPDSDRSEGR